MRNPRCMIRISCSLLGVFACIVLSMQSALAQSDQPLESRLVEELRIYQKSFHGLSWTTTSSVTDDVRAEHVSTMRFRYSNDGQILESESEVSGRADGAVDPNRPDRAVTKSYRKEGWIFNASGYSPDRGESRETTPKLSVTFYDTSSDGAIANGAGLQMGFIERWTFAEFAKASSNEVESEPINGTDYWALKCDHPDCGTATFYFDTSDRLLLRYYRYELASGDKTKFRGICETDKPHYLVKEGEWARHLSGPIEYAEVGPFLLPSRIPQESTNTEEEGTKFLNVTRFTEFAPLQEELSPVIQFDFLPLPGDGRKRDTGLPGLQISSQGEPTVSYELRAGKIVRDVD